MTIEVLNKKTIIDAPAGIEYTNLFVNASDKSYKAKIIIHMPSAGSAPMPIHMKLGVFDKFKTFTDAEFDDTTIVAMPNNNFNKYEAEIWVPSYSSIHCAALSAGNSYLVLGIEA